MNAADTFTAAIPEPFQILGLALKPFCLGHYYAMRRFDVAFVSDESCDATVEDLILGVLICSMTPEDFLEFISSATCKEEIKTWGEQIGLQFDLSEKVQLFNDYIERASRQPVIIYTGETSGSGSHWSQTIKYALLNSGLSLQEATNLPLSEAFALFYKRAEENGVIEFADPELAKQLMEDA